jgi:RNA-binding protein 25
VALLTDPNAVAPTLDGLPARSGSPISVFVPPHLQDLKEGDLPEEQRTVVLDQIAIFRENAAKREREKKMMEDEKERFKAMEARNTNKGPPIHPGATSAYGYGNRALGHQSESRQTQPSPSANRADPQGYSQPVAFVKPQSAENKAESERTDEEEEEIRRQRRDRDRNAALRDVSNLMLYAWKLSV